MKMRDLEKRTGVHRESIRVYLRHGLLPPPLRPKPNVAEYEESHVRGILAIRRLQSERRLPLSQIKRVLEGDALALPADAGAFPHLDSLVAARVGVDSALVRLDSVEARNPHAAADARAFARVGAIDLKRRGGRLYVSRADAQLVSLWGDMRQAGYGEERGFRPEIVRMYVKAAASLARTEVSEFLSAVSPQLDEQAAAEMAQQAFSSMLAFFGLLRMKAVLAEMKRQAARPAAATARRKRRVQR